MATKIIYFIRHGESELNARGIRQGPDGPLSARGREQIQKAAEGFSYEPQKIEAIISSPFQRTKESADIISKVLKLPVEYSDLLVERKNPTEIVGHARVEQGVQTIVDRIDKGYHPDDFRYSDEENFADLKKRAQELLKYISKRKEKRILMVTHGIFLTLLASYISEGEALTANDYAAMTYKNVMDNAGVVICSYKSHWIDPDEWNIVVWNAVPLSQFKPSV